MVWILKIVTLLTLAAWPSECLHGQEPNPEANAIVSGTVTDLQPNRIVINRAVLGKPAEERAFLITSETKVEGKLRVNARVTVGYRPSEEGDIATRIIVRSQPGGK